MSIDVRRASGTAAVSTGALATMWELDLDYVPSARFASLVLERALPHISAATWPTERMTLDGLYPYAVTTFRDRTERSAVLDLTEIVDAVCLVFLTLEYETAYARFAADRVAALAEAEAWVRERYPQTMPEEEQRVTMTFWSQNNQGRRSSRRITVPSWPDVRPNYPHAVAEPLDTLMHEEFRPSSGGQLVLWHGEPGTGKTSALRALSWQWREWCRFHYVTDPETFFGSSPKYMLDVLLDEEDDEMWRLLILEDTGELIASDAKLQTGQGLSRLLNVVDGLIGQGLRVVLLVTTNEPLKRLHPAVARPGRCAASIEFAAFTADEAAAWLERNDAEPVASSATLAQLYARRAGVELPTKQRVGFVS
jgi:hypothetical protein